MSLYCSHVVINTYPYSAPSHFISSPESDGNIPLETFKYCPCPEDGDIINQSSTTTHPSIDFWLLPVVTPFFSFWRRNIHARRRGAYTPRAEKVVTFSSRFFECHYNLSNIAKDFSKISILANGKSTRRGEKGYDRRTPLRIIYPKHMCYYYTFSYRRRR